MEGIRPNVNYSWLRNYKKISKYRRDDRATEVYIVNYNRVFFCRLNVNLD